MKKNKEIKKRFFSWRFVARIFVINLPAYFVLTVLLLAGKIGWQTAGFLFLLVTVLVVIITAFVFRDLETFILYLKKIAADEEIEMPRFHRGKKFDFYLILIFLLLYFLLFFLFLLKLLHLYFLLFRKIHLIPHA